MLYSVCGRIFKFRPMHVFFGGDNLNFRKAAGGNPPRSFGLPTKRLIWLIALGAFCFASEATVPGNKRKHNCSVDCRKVEPVTSISITKTTLLSRSGGFSPPILVRCRLHQRAVRSAFIVSMAPGLRRAALARVRESYERLCRKTY